MLKALICDLDGTILDTISSIAYYMNDALSKLGYGSVRESDCNYFAGDGSRVLARRALNSLGVFDEEKISALHDLYKATYDTAPLCKTEVFPFVKETLLTLKERGVKLGVISNKPHSATVPIVKHFFGDIFDLVLGYSGEFPLKPAPDSAIYAARVMGITTDEIAYIGDTSTDIEFAKGFGAGKKIGVLWGFRDYGELRAAGADLIISNIEEVLTLF